MNTDLPEMWKQIEQGQAFSEILGLLVAEYTNRVLTTQGCTVVHAAVGEQNHVGVIC